MGLDYDELFPGRFIKSGEFKGRDVTLTMAGIELEEFPQDKGGDRTRGIISFRETKKKWVLNRTNGECVKAMFGRNTDDWIGKRVTLYPADYQGETAIRVKGSPDIREPLDAEVKLPRKRPIMMRMIPTGKGANGAKAGGRPKHDTPVPLDEDPGVHPDDREPGLD